MFSQTAQAFVWTCTEPLDWVNVVFLWCKDLNFLNTCGSMDELCILEYNPKNKNDMTGGITGGCQTILWARYNLDSKLGCKKDTTKIKGTSGNDAQKTSHFKVCSRGPQTDDE